MIINFNFKKDFADHFNAVSEILTEIFPNIKIIGNYDSPEKRLNHFEVYIRGVGAFQERDEEGKYLLYQKRDDLKFFLENYKRLLLKMYDKLILLIVNYGVIIFFKN